MDKKNIKAPIGNKLTCKGWEQEAAYRMIQNNLDSEVAEKPDDLIVYGGIGKAARNWECYEAILESLKELENDDAYIDNNKIEGRVIEGLFDDLNTPKVIAELNILSNQIASADKKIRSKIKYNLLEVGKIIGIIQDNPDNWLGYGNSGNLDETTIERLIKERNEARGNKNFDLADKIRNELKEKGIEIEDTKNGTIWKSA